MTMREIDVVIVGAGLSGLMAGRQLADSGLNVAIFESAPVVGGRAMTHSIGRGEPIRGRNSLRRARLNSRQLQRSGFGMD